MAKLVARSISPIILFLLPALSFYFVFELFPIFYSLYISFFEWHIIGDVRFVGLENYFKMFSDPVFIVALRNTFIYTIVTVPTQIFFGLAIALLLNQKIRGKVTFRALYYIPVITSWTVVSLIWKWIYDPVYGFLNYVLLSLGAIREPVRWLQDPSVALCAVMLVTIWKGIGWNMVIFLAGLQTIPQSLYDAALIDGANRWRRFRYITLPLLRPVIATVTVLLTIGALNAFVQIYILTAGGPLHSTEVINTYLYKNAFSYLNFGYASSMAMFLLALTLTISIVQRKVLSKKIEY
ncbi:MAG: lactose ABC transporter permease [Desulfurococcales archaeon ex4484_217_2]|nr:MAG: lactose ABC transporter permease [Desulfurococcales archaeon ex4484_217_2]